MSVVGNQTNVTVAGGSVGISGQPVSTTATLSGTPSVNINRDTGSVSSVVAISVNSATSASYTVPAGFTANVNWMANYGGGISWGISPTITISSSGPIICTNQPPSSTGTLGNPHYGQVSHLGPGQTITLAGSSNGGTANLNLRGVAFRL